MRPGSSSLRGSTLVPWKRASVCSTPRARVGAGHRGLAEREGDAPARRAPAVTEHQLGVAGLDRRLAVVVGPAFLDAEEVGEVGLDGELDGDVRGLVAVVVHDDVLPQAAAD